MPRKRTRATEGLTAEDLLQLITAIQRNSSKTTLNTNVVPEFDPDNKSQDVDRWLKKVNECSSIYGWDEKQTIHYSLQKLCGLAKKWYESLPSLDFSWDEWQSKFKKAFPNDVNYGKLLEEMLNRKSRTDETLRDYFYDKLSLLSRCEIVGRKAVDCIIYGIADSSIRNGAQALKCTEPEGLLSYLASQQTTLSKDFMRGNLATNTFRKRDFRGNNLQNRHSSSIRDIELICFNCNERGHTFRSCRKPIIKCTKCSRVGHDSENCARRPLQSHGFSSPNIQPGEKNKNVQRVISIQPTVLTDELQRNCGELNKDLSVPIDNTIDSDSKYYKHICVNGTMLNAFIDFGSECSLIKLSKATELNLPEKFELLPIIKGFGNSSVVPKFKSTLQVRIDEVEAELNVLVVDDMYLNTPMLIGQDFTELPSVTVMKDKGMLVFYHTPSDAPGGVGKPLEMYVAKDVVITKGGLVEVYCRGLYTGDVYADGSTRLSLNQEYHLHQGCYTVNEGKALIFVTALTNAPLTFKADKLIARVNPIVETKSFVIQTGGEAKQLLPLQKSDIKIDESTEQVVQDQLYELLQKYRNCFATDLSELGCSKDTEMNINLQDQTPVVYRPYRLSHHERQNVRAIVDDLIHNDIVQESSSNYASPILLVKKKSGESRLCVDYRALNNKTIKDKYPLPLIDDQVSNLSGNKYFITLDLSSGYYQIPMSKESQHLTAFVTPDGHYEFKRMPFGLANAPSVFQRMMNGLLGSRRFKSALAYMDDLLIPAATIEEGFVRLEDVLKVIQGAGLTLNLSKCSFFVTKIEYLGYEISSEGIKPSERKISAVRDFPTPRNVHEVRQFLGLANYFRRFVKGFGEIARPLTTLLKKDLQWQWTDKEIKSFETLKDLLIKRPLLALYDPDLDTEVHTDASSLGLGGILMQWQASPRVLKPVAYFSRQTTPEERHFHSYELETLAVVCSLKKFRSYLLGLAFTIYTDCNALRTTLTKRDLIPRIARWWLQICEYNFTIEYRPGCRMGHVDALSRNPPNKTTSHTIVSTLNISTENWILTLQMADHELERIFKILKPDSNEEITEIKKNYVVKNNALYRKVGEDLRLVIPKDARWQICKANHDDVGHFGIAKSLERIQSRYWFPKLKRFVKKYVAACIDCAYNKDSSVQARSGFLHPIPKVEQPFLVLHLDHLGPFVRSKARNSYILTIVDGFTKYLFAKPVKDTKTKSVIKALESLFADFAVPRRIITDRGTAFTSAQFKEFCVSKGIKHILNAVACPRANGQAERFNKTILTALSTQTHNKDERTWDEQLGKVQWGINNTINASTKKSASELLFGVQLNGPVDNMLLIEDIEDELSHNQTSDSLATTTTFDQPSSNQGNLSNTSRVEHTASIENFIDVSEQRPSGSHPISIGGTDVGHLEHFLPDPSRVVENDLSELSSSVMPTDIEKIRKEAASNIRVSQERQKKAYDSRRLPAITYREGDLIKITKTNFNNDGKSKKLMPKFIGPYKVTKCLGNDRYEISNIPGFSTKKYHSVVAVDRMRPWINIQSLEINRSCDSIGSNSSGSDED